MFRLSGFFLVVCLLLDAFCWFQGGFRLQNHDLQPARKNMNRLGLGVRFRTFLFSIAVLIDRLLCLFSLWVCSLSFFRFSWLRFSSSSLPTSSFPSLFHLQHTGPFISLSCLSLFSRQRPMRIFAMDHPKVIPSHLALAADFTTDAKSGSALLSPAFALCGCLAGLRFHKVALPRLRHLRDGFSKSTFRCLSLLLFKCKLPLALQHLG